MSADCRGDAQSECPGEARGLESLSAVAGAESASRGVDLADVAPILRLLVSS